MIYIPKSRSILTNDDNNVYIDEALLQQSQIAGLSRPRDVALGVFRNVFDGHKEINAKMLSGSAKHMLDDGEDLVSVKVPGDRALLAQFLRNHWPHKVTQHINHVSQMSR